MIKKYELKNVKANDLSYKLNALLEVKSLSCNYEYNEATNVLTLEGNSEMINNDLVALKVAIHDIDGDIEIEEILEEKVYRKVLMLQNLDCANCASKVERISQRTFANYETLSVDFVTSRFIIETKDKSILDNLEEKVQEIAKKVDRNIVVRDMSKKEEIKEEDHKLERILFIAGSIVFVITFLLHYFILPVISTHVAGFDYKVDLIANNDIIPYKYWYMIVLCFIAYGLLGGDIILGAVNNIRAGRIFDEKFLMALATIVAFAIGSYIEAASVMIFYKIGELLQEYVVNKSRRSIAELMNIKPAMARLIYNGKEMEVDPGEIVPNDIILVKPGERIPLDGVVESGEASLDTSALTGESKYSDITKGDNVISGAIIVDGVLQIRVKKSYQNSMVSKILDLVQNANVNKGKTEKFISKFAKYYTPIICGLALVIVLINLIVFTVSGPSSGYANIHDCIYPGMIFLVVSCPCALVISVPMSYFGAIGGAGKKGILIKGSNYLEQLNNVGRVVFDKTGTLTKGQFKIKNIVSTNPSYSDNDIFKIAAYCEIVSNHPIAKAIVNEYGKDNIDLFSIEAIDVNKKGAVVKFDDQVYVIGSQKKMEEETIHLKEIKTEGLVVYIATNKKIIGYIILEDEIKDDSIEAINELKKMGIKVAMLTGDNENVASSVASKLSIDEYYSNLNPIDKVKKLRKMKKSSIDKNQIFVGDGINDAPVLSNSDIGIAMGALGSDAAIEVADVVLMTDELTKLPDAIKIAKKTRVVVLENIIFALVIKLVVLLIAVLPISIPLMWEAVFADVGVSLIATINSLRAANIKYDSWIHKLLHHNEKKSE